MTVVHQTKLFLPVVVALALVTACADDEPSARRGGARYAVAYTTFGSQAETMTYVNLLDALDVAEVDASAASEHPGWATIAAHDGKLFVSSGEAPEITRYRVDGGDLVAEGSVHFGTYGLASAPFYTNVFVDGTTAYMNLEQVDRVVWDPATLTIAGTADAPGVAMQRDGMNVFAAYDRGIAVRDGHVFQPFYWTDPDFYAYHAQSQIAVYGPDDRLVELLDVPCPALDTVTQDEEGNLYFSIWSGTAAYRVLDEAAPPSCVVRIKAGEQTVDASWTRRFEELTGGRQTAMFRYLQGGVGIVAVLHDERIDIQPDTAAGTVNYGSNWKLWRVDLAAWTAEPIDGLPWFAGGYYSFTLDGRTLVLLPSADFASTRAYEIRLDGTVTPRFVTPGWAYQLVKLD